MRILKNFVAVLALGFGLIACGGAEKQEEATNKNEVKVETSEKSEAAKAVYYCPMKCEGEKTYAQAGSCPKCGMDLVVLADAGSAQDSHAGHNHDDHSGHNH